MLNKHLELPKEDRSKLLKKIKPETKKHIFNRIYTMTEELGLDKVPDYETRVKMRHELIQKFPDVVFWDYLEHWDYQNKLLIRSDKIKISTNGDFVNFFTNKNGTNKLYISPLNIESEDSPYQHYRYMGRSLVKHRAIATTFIPKDERIMLHSCHILTVNHENYMRTDNRVFNLEWVTGKENTRHGVGQADYKETEYALFEVAVDCGYLGTKFYLNSDEMEEIKIPFNRIRHYEKIGYKAPIRSFLIKTIKESELKDIPKGMPKGVKDLLDKGYLDSGKRNTPIKVIVMEGKYKGLVSSFITRKEAGKFFDPRSISKQVNKEANFLHYGCKFIKISLRKAIPLHNKISDETFKLIIKENKRLY